jgi:hypothetical protein
MKCMEHMHGMMGSGGMRNGGMEGGMGGAQPQASPSGGMVAACTMTCSSASLVRCKSWSGS